MVLYYYIGSVVILLQLLILLQVYNNYRFALNKYHRPRDWYVPKTVLIVPCKGLDTDFEKNIRSFFELDYDNYLLWFVVEDINDAAYKKLNELKGSGAFNSEVEILVAGKGAQCSQKIHNLLYCIEKISDDIEVLAFADSDICIRKDWLSHLVYPLHRKKNGAASGYRWFIPKSNNIATLALSAMNAKVAQLLGNTIFNQAWGGSMAIRVETFKETKLEEIWQKALSDDLSLSYAVKKAGLKVAFVPACLAASFESSTWSQTFEFAKRQFLITKVFSPATWSLAVLSSTFSVFALWGALAIALYANSSRLDYIWFYFAVPALSFISQFLRAVTRQRMIGKLLKDYLPKLKYAIVADILFFWLWSIILWLIILLTSIGRTIRWRGIRYKVISPTETVILPEKLH